MKVKRVKFKYAREIPNLPNGEHQRWYSRTLAHKTRHGKTQLVIALPLQRQAETMDNWTSGSRILERGSRRARTRPDDPQGEKKQQRLDEANTVTFEQLSDRYIKEWAEQNQRFWKQTRSALRHPRFNSWKRRPVTEIERRDVKKLLATISGGGLANQVRAHLHALFNFALDEDLLLVNPVARTKRRFVQSRDRVLTDDEIRSVWKVPIFG